MIKKYKFVVVATDIVIFTVEDDKLKVLLIKMKKKPFTDYYAVPGGLINVDESIEKAAKRVLLKQTGIKNFYLEQLHTFSDVNRDPFGRVVSTAYFALIASTGLNLKTTKEFQNVAWFGVKKLPKLAYDHKEIINFAISNLRKKLIYNNIVYNLLPKEFTLTNLQKTYEIILGKKLDKRNFRKKIVSLNLVKKTNRLSSGDAHRPAVLYKMNDDVIM